MTKQIIIGMQKEFYVCPFRKYSVDNSGYPFYDIVDYYLFWFHLTIKTEADE